MIAGRAGARTIAALGAGVALGAGSTAGIALLLYTGQGFLRAAGLLVSSTVMAVAAGLWAGAPEPRSAVRNATRGRWITLMFALLAGAVFSALWSTRAPVREHALGGAFAVLLVLAFPAYAAGALLAGMHAGARARTDSIAAAAMGGSAFGVLLAAAVLIQTFEPYGVYFAAAALVGVVSLLDRQRSPTPTNTGDAHMIDRVVMVTGAAHPGQLGFSVARRFLEAGARVVISGRSESLDAAATALADHGAVVAMRADLTHDDDVTALIEQTHTQFGRLDALINVAGGLSLIATVEDTTPEEWEREVERNAGTVLRVTRAALPLLRASRGAIVNFTSPAALKAPARLAAYSAAKAAVIALTRSLAIEEKDSGVRVNAIAPGLMDTEQNRAECAAGTVFVRREDVANVALFLAGADAAGITGETVHVLAGTIH